MISERRTLTLVLGGLAAIAVTALVSWFFTNFEPKIERIPIGYSTEARRNSLLAAERFLARLEVPVESVAGRARLWNLPAPTDTLVVLGLGPMSAGHSARLMAWLEQGGHLVVEAIDIWDEETPPRGFLSELGLRLHFDPSDTSPTEDDGKTLAQVSLPETSRSLKVSFQSHYSLEGDTDDSLIAGTEDHPRVLRRQIGQGWLTVLSDSDFLTNTEIGDHDHAFFSARLVAPKAGGKVWLLYDIGMPWLGAVLWGSAPYALASAGLLTLLWLWSLGRRLGPLQQSPGRQRRDLIEHLDASGDFLWRHGRASQLMDSSRRRILSAWLRRRPDVAQAERHRQAEALAEFADEPVEQVYRALFAQPDDARAFVDQAAMLQRLRESKRGTGGER